MAEEVAKQTIRVTYFDGETEELVQLELKVGTENYIADLKKYAVMR